MRAREVNRRPSLTEAQVAALKVGDRVRDIPNYLYKVVGIGDGLYGEKLFTLAVWVRKWKCWTYVIHPDWEMAIRYTSPGGNTVAREQL